MCMLKNEKKKYKKIQLQKKNEKNTTTKKYN